MKKVTENPALLARECLEGGIISGVVSSPRGAGPNAGSGLFDKIRIRPIELKNGACFQLEQFRGTKVFHRNIGASELESLIALWLEGDYARAEFTTVKGSVHILANRRGELAALRKGVPKPEGDKPESAKEAVQTHNRSKKYILEEGIPVPFLIDLGVMTKEGTVVKAMYDKFRQINRFLEFIADVMGELRSAAGQSADGKPLREIKIIDFGCGKSYLTFAVYYYLTRLQKMPVSIVGLDLKEDVIANCSALARGYGYEGLHFAVGDIADFAGTDSADLVISLHACDTATDLALAQAVRWKARVILAVPCCQHEMNGQLAAHPAPQAGAAPGRAVLKPAFKHGIIRERMAALFTDALRAELLEAEGYQVQILEFVDMSHTPKNLLIRAVRIDRAAKSEKGTPPAEKADYLKLRDFLGVEPALEKELT